jgi:hypothetical protein
MSAPGAEAPGAGFGPDTCRLTLDEYLPQLATLSCGIDSAADF